jgi:catechol 2,3-dioxygenase-like lactoylglutathione lyase family enzyme
VNFTALDHVGFAVRDLDRSVDFYTLLLGEGPVIRKVWDVDYLARASGYPGLRVEAAFWQLPGTSMLELVQYLTPPPGSVDMEAFNVGNAHLSLVTADLHADYERLREHAHFRCPTPTRIEWGPYEGGWVGRIRDPDDITIELVQLPAGGVNLA